jgi:ketosteroid isomerase-like protein
VDDQTTIRKLIERWAAAAHDGDLATVLADHDPAIVMFDVPPPEDGVRGLAAYEATWPGFFEWQQGASFDLLSLEVVAGPEVAFAYGLLRCGTPEELAAVPDRRLRLTVGLRKVEGRWTVLHEHHSITARD